MKAAIPAIVIVIVALFTIASAFSIPTVAYNNPTFAHTNGVISYQNPTIVHGNPFIAVPVGISAYIGTGTAGRDPKSNAPRDDRCAIALFDRLSDNAPKPMSLRWDELVDLLRRHDIRQDKDGRLFSPAQYAVGARRGNEGVLALTAFVGDIDDGWPLSSAESVLRRGGWGFVIYTTHSHTAGKAKYRVVVPFLAPVATAEWERVWLQLNEMFGGHLDPGTKDPARISFLPSHPPGAPSEVRVGEGRPLDVSALPPLVDIEAVCAKLGALPLGAEAAEIARRLHDGRITTDGWPGDANDWFVQMLADAGLTPREVERFHRHQEVVRHTSDWADRAKRVSKKGADGQPKKTFHLKRTTLEQSPFFQGIAEEVRRRRPAPPAGDRTDEPGPVATHGGPWEGRPGWTEDPLLPIVKKDVEGEDGKTNQVPKEPAIVEYNHLVRDLHYRPFRTLDGQSRVAIPGTYGLEVHDPRGPKFVDQLGYRGYTLRGEPAPRAALFRTAVMLDQRALDRSLPAERIVDLRLRVAPIEGGSLLDLHDPKSRCVRVTADGWGIETIGHPVFESPANMLSLPDPTPPRGAPAGAAQLPDLWRFLTPASGESPVRIRLLVAALLVQPLVDPDLPRPILVVLGLEGSGKSQQSATVQAVLDPSVTETLDAPKTVEILADELRVRNTLNLDNVSSIPTWLSDALCRASGGGGLAKRALYTDKGEVLTRSVRSVILNGITAEPRRPDMLRRCVFFVVDPETKKVDPQRLRREWRDAHPAVLSSLLDLAVAVLRIRRDTPPPPSDDSMAGFVEVGRAVAIAHGLDPSEFDAAWAEMVAEQGSIAAEDPWAAALADALKQVPEGVETTAAQLARWITESRADLFPRGVGAEELGHRIGRVEKTLRTTRGVAVRKRHTRVGATYSWTKVPESTVTPSPSGQTTLEPLTGDGGSAVGDGSRDGSVTVASNRHPDGDGVTVVMGDSKPDAPASGESPVGPVMEEPDNWTVAPKDRERPKEGEP